MQAFAGGSSAALGTFKCSGRSPQRFPEFILESPEVRLGPLGVTFGHPESIRSSSFRCPPFEMLLG